MAKLLLLVVGLALVTACGKEVSRPGDGSRDELKAPRGENSPPLAGNATFYMSKNGEKNIYLIGSDFDAEALTYEVVVPPSYGTLSGEGSTLVYKPGLNYVGTERFIYRVSDGSAQSENAVITIVVSP